MTLLVDLAPLETEVQRALATNDQSRLHVIGYGEITSVLAWPDADGPWACKRLPAFDTKERLDGYRERFGEYIAAITQCGVSVQDSRLEVVPTDAGLFVYIVQPTIEAEALAPAILRGASADDGRALLTQIIDHIGSIVTPTLGFDAQLSNWARIDGELLYFDVSTPMLRDSEGNDLLDTELFIASLPAVLRPIMRRFLLGSVLDQFFEPRGTVLDFVANLHKDRLQAWIPMACTIANDRLALEQPLAVEETRRYFRENQRTWALLQAMRKADRFWQQRVRRRPYTFLLPGRINRSL